MKTLCISLACLLLLACQDKAKEEPLEESFPGEKHAPGEAPTKPFRNSDSLQKPEDLPPYVPKKEQGTTEEEAEV